MGHQTGDIYSWSHTVKDKDSRLSSLQAEPDRARCDFLFGVKTPNVLTKAQAEVFRVLVEPTSEEAQPATDAAAEDLSNSAEEDQADDLADGAATVADDLIIYIGEYTHTDKSIKAQCTLMELDAAVCKLATYDIYDCPVFATVTEGPIAVVYTAWGIKIPDEDPKPKAGPPVYVYIASYNPPTFDITNINQTIHFATFLLHLRHLHAQRVADRFEEVRPQVIERLKSNDPVLQWTLEQQRCELKQELDDLKRRQEAAFVAVRRLRESEPTSALEACEEHEEDLYDHDDDY
ncbi:hypothetical protein OE88DRAFT_816798 [Heliocybe sulcata]|uniref:Uncharacterized protein n=1 Tax=Heliocybe sulcata TaxID=5364 RepID=A0A5C3MP39_9AGAM|nr:hypothetical protein OE88DRAFT_816798 [Heliocybe sulcata]